MGLEHICDFYFKSNRATWISDFTDRISQGLQDHVFPDIEDDEEGKSEIFNWLEMWAACHYYGKAPSTLASSEEKGNFGGERMISLKRFMQIFRALASKGVFEKGTDDEWNADRENAHSLVSCLDKLVRLYPLTLKKITALLT